MIVPSWWQAVLLVLAAYRLTRLGGWDAFPPVAKLRAGLIGEEWKAGPRHVATFEEYVALVEDRARLGGSAESIGPIMVGFEPTAPEIPGKKPTSVVAGVRPGYRRPTLAHLVHCPFCLGWWVTLACWGSFELWHHWALVALSPFALAGAVGLVGKDLD